MYIRMLCTVLPLSKSFPKEGFAQLVLTKAVNAFGSRSLCSVAEKGTAQQSREKGRGFRGSAAAGVPALAFLPCRSLPWYLSTFLSTQSSDLGSLSPE